MTAHFQFWLNEMRQNTIENILLIVRSCNASCRTAWLLPPNEVSLPQDRSVILIC